MYKGREVLLLDVEQSSIVIAKKGFKKYNPKYTDLNSLLL